MVLDCTHRGGLLVGLLVVLLVSPASFAAPANLPDVAERAVGVEAQQPRSIPRIRLGAQLEEVRSSRRASVETEESGEVPRQPRFGACYARVRTLLERHHLRPDVLE